MRRAAIGGGWLIWAGLMAGCNQNPYLTPPAAAVPPVQMAPYQSQLYDLNRRATSLDANNRDLHAQLAQSQQQTQLLRDQVALLQKQLGETARQLQTTEAARTAAEQRYQTLQASTTQRGGAMITANNSLTEPLRAIEIPGLEIRQDGDRLRIELPADQLFAPNTSQLIGSAFPILDRVAAEIVRNYPRQMIGIEGHTDAAPVYGGISNQQLAVSQALAVFEQFTRRNRLPEDQFVVSGQGARQPLASNGTQAGRAKNRRVELVIHPELVTTR
jgi:flagellar motor protein MotB